MEEHITLVAVRARAGGNLLSSPGLPPPAEERKIPYGVNMVIKHSQLS